MSSHDEKMVTHRSLGGRPLSSLANLRKRWRGPEEKWKRPPELIFLRTADGKVRETWKLYGPADGEASMYEQTEAVRESSEG